MSALAPTQGSKHHLSFISGYVEALAISVTLATLGLPKRPGPLEDPLPLPTGHLNNQMFQKLFTVLEQGL